MRISDWSSDVCSSDLIARASDLLGFSAKDADRLRKLAPGEFYAMGPALSPLPVLAHIGETITEHLGVTPTLTAAADVDLDEASRLLDIAADRKSPRLNSITNAHLVCRLLLEKKKNTNH